MFFKLAFKVLEDKTIIHNSHDIEMLIDSLTAIIAGEAIFSLFVEKTRTIPSLNR